MADYAVHRCQLFEYTPRSIQCMSSCMHPNGSKDIIGLLAVGRENGAIELLRHTKSGFYVYLTIPGSTERNLEDLLFCDGRLYSAELQGVISEYDLKKGNKKYSEDGYGGAVWCLAAGYGNEKLAAGCEDGSLKIFSCSGERLEFEKSMDRQDGRILSCSFHPNNQFLASGSVDVIRIWSYQSGHAVQRIRLDSRKTDNIVWAVKMLSDHTVVSGDSMGKICFWNGKNATQTHSFEIHKGGVLSLCVSEDESTVYASGVDPRVVALHRQIEQNGIPMDVRQPLGMEIPPPPESVWVKGETLQVHTHDVRALTIIGEFLASGGVDTNILLFQTKLSARRQLRKISPYPHQSIVHFSPKTERLLLQYRDYLDIWQLGIAEDVPRDVGDKVWLERQPVKLCQLKSSSSDPNEISCSAMSNCGHWVAYGTCITFKLLWLSWVDEEICILKTRTPWIKSPAAISFCPDSKYCIVTSLNGKVYVMKLNLSGLVHLEHVIKPEEGHSCPSVKIAANCKYFAAADLEDNIRVYSLEKPELKCVLPKRDSFPTVFSFKPSSNCLFIAYHNHSVIEYDVDSEAYTDWSKHAIKADFNLSEYAGRFASKPKRALCWNTSPITHITFPDAEAKNIVFASHGSVFFVDYLTDVFKKFNFAKEPFFAVVNASRESGSPMSCPVKKYNQFENILCCSFFRNGASILAVERPWRDVCDNLPPSLYLKKYGT